MRKSLIGAALSLLLLATAREGITAEPSAGPPWPDFQVNMSPYMSLSRIDARLPPDVEITTPGPEVPPDLARLSGEWRGWMCQNATCDTKLAVEKLTLTGGRIVYAFARDGAERYLARVEAKWDHGELSAALPGGTSHVKYRMRSDGHLDVMWWRGGGSNWATGVLNKYK